MTVCAIKWCSNSSGKQNKSTNITFHRFPSDPIVADKWVKKIRLSRQEECWKPTKNTRICSIHFDDDDKYITQGGLCRLRRTAIPTEDLHIFSCKTTDTPESMNMAIKDEILDCQEQSGSSDTQAMTQTSLRETPHSFLQPSTPPILSRHSSISDSIFDPYKAALRRKLKKSTLLAIKHRRIIKTLKQKFRRLQKRNKSLKGIIAELRKKR